MGYTAYFYCDECNSKWEVFYGSYNAMARGDACQTCLDSHKMVVVETHYYVESTEEKE